MRDTMIIIVLVLGAIIAWKRHILGDSKLDIVYPRCSAVLVLIGVISLLVLVILVIIRLTSGHNLSFPLDLVELLAYLGIIIVMCVAVWRMIKGDSGKSTPE